MWHCYFLLFYNKVITQGFVFQDHTEHFDKNYASFLGLGASLGAILFVKYQNNIVLKKVDYQMKYRERSFMQLYRKLPFSNNQVNNHASKILYVNDFE